MKNDQRTPSANETNNVEGNGSTSMQESILALWKQSRLLEAFATFQLPNDEEQREAMYEELAELHNSGEINIFDIYREDQTAAFEPSAFFTIQSVYCNVLPALKCDPIVVMHTTKHMVEQGGDDLASSDPNRAFREWCKQSDEHPKMVIQALRDHTGTDFGLLRFACEAGAIFDPAHYLDEALNFSAQQEAHFQLGGLSALGTIELPSASHQSIAVERILSMFGAAKESSLQAHCLTALMHRFAANPENWSETFSRTIEQIDVEPSAEVQSFIATTLACEIEILTESQMDTLLIRLQKIDPNHIGLVRKIDQIISVHGARLEKTRISKLIHSILLNSAGLLSLRNFDTFFHRLRRDDSGTRDALLLEWLCLGEKWICADLGSLYTEINERELNTKISFDNLELSDEKIVRISRLSVVSFRLAPRTTTRILIAAMRPAGKVARAEVAEILLNHVVLSAPSDASAVISEVRSKQPSEIRKILDEIVEKLDTYIDDIQSIGYVAELQPTALERQISRERAALNMRESQKRASENSIVSLFSKKATLLFGSGSVSYYPKDESGKLHRTEMMMSTQTVSMSYPRIDIVDPAGWSNLDFYVSIEDGKE